MSNSSTSKKTCNQCQTVGKDFTVLLGTIECCIQDSWGAPVLVRAVLDPGSEISVITSSLVNRLGLSKLSSNYQIEGIGRGVTRSLGNVSLTINPVNSPPAVVTLQAAILPIICDQLSKSQLSHDLLQKFHSLGLADPKFWQPGRIQLLIGADAYPDVLSTKEPTIIAGNPTAIRTKFGYVIINKTDQHLSGSTPLVKSLHISATPLDETISEFWEVKEVESTVTSDHSDMLCEKHFSETHERDPEGRFVVKLPFLPNAPPLGINEGTAMKRLRSLERRLQKDPALSKAYEERMNEYIALGYIPLSSLKATYLLPHLAVFKESSSTTKCRVVFDCSAKDDKGLSLNDRLYRGPPLLQDISLLLMNFRFYRICMVADIKMMYRMISVHPSDRQNLVVAWRSNQYQMTRLPFGLKPAGFIAGRWVVKLANLYQEEFPPAAKAIKYNRYADDFCTGAETLEEAKKLQSELSEILRRGGFKIRRWSSNNQDVLSHVDEDFKETPLKLPSGDDGVKVLGVLWDQSNDTFVAKIIKFDSSIISKRTVLSYIAKIYDVMGFFCPTVFLAKYFMQCLWLLKIDWDESLPDELFVSNRVSQIYQLVSAGDWGHVKGCENPADLGSRGLSAEKLKTAELWWYGPEFLKKPFSEWPKKPKLNCSSEELPEIKSSTSLMLQTDLPVDDVIRRFSSFSKMQKMLAYTQR